MTKTKSKYQDMCWDCGKKTYVERRKGALDGIGVSLAACPICGKKGGIVPARDWAFYEGVFEKSI